MHNISKKKEKQLNKKIGENSNTLYMEDSTTTLLNEIREIIKRLEKLLDEKEKTKTQDNFLPIFSDLSTCLRCRHFATPDWSKLNPCANCIHRGEKFPIVMTNHGGNR